MPLFQEVPLQTKEIPRHLSHDNVIVIDKRQRIHLLFPIMKPIDILGNTVEQHTSNNSIDYNIIRLAKDNYCPTFRYGPLFQWQVIRNLHICIAWLALNSLNPLQSPLSIVYEI